MSQGIGESIPPDDGKGLDEASELLLDRERVRVEVVPVPTAAVSSLTQLLKALWLGLVIASEQDHNRLFYFPGGGLTLGEVLVMSVTSWSVKAPSSAWKAIVQVICGLCAVPSHRAMFAEGQTDTETVLSQCVSQSEDSSTSTREERRGTRR